MFLTGIIGFPLIKTLSPEMHNRAFRALGLEGRYLTFRVKGNDLKSALQGLKALGFSGVNITNPYKEKVIDLLDQIDRRAKKIGAVNTIVIRDRRLYGYNTDAEGFEISLAVCRIHLRRKKVLLIGAGGGARAVAYVLRKNRPEKYYVCNRTRKKAMKLIQVFGGELLKSNRLEKSLPEFDLVINATTVDLQARCLKRMRKGSTYYDLNYRFKMRKKKGVKMVNGLLMLVYQGAGSFRLWTKRRPPIKVMKRAVGVI